MRKWHYFCLIFILSMLLMGSQVKTHPVEHMVNMMQEMNITPNQWMIHVGDAYPESLSKSDMKILASELASGLALSNPVKRVNDQEVVYESKGTIAHGFHAQLIVTDFEPNQVQSQPYISIKVTAEKTNDKKFLATYHQVKDLLTNNHMEPILFCSLQGSKIDSSLQKQNLITEVLQSFHAKEIEGIQTDQLMSVSAFSPYFGHDLTNQGLQTPQGSINLQTAVRINPNNHQLILTIGTPLITIEY